jgi:surface antigen
MLKLQTISKTLIISALFLTTTSCTKETTGGFFGAIGGALIGSEITGGSDLGIILGSVYGSILGGEIGRQLDEADQLKMYQTTQNALEKGVSGNTSTWYNPDSGHRGTVTPQPRLPSRGGQVCREYHQTVTIANEQKTAYGTACRQSDGSWKIINS